MKFNEQNGDNLKRWS